MANKKEIIRLDSSAGTGYFKTTTNSSDNKLKLRKYDPKIRKYVEFTQEKISKKKK